MATASMDYLNSAKHFKITQPDKLLQVDLAGNNRTTSVAGITQKPSFIIVGIGTLNNGYWLLAHDCKDDTELVSGWYSAWQPLSIITDPASKYISNVSDTGFVLTNHIPSDAIIHFDMYVYY